jgi:triacylglycerol lipase
MGGTESCGVGLPAWNELLVGIEMIYLRISPVYWGFGVPRGDGSAVVVVPAFMGTDLYLAEFRAWVNRIGYKSFSSGIGRNAECPNLLGVRLGATVEKAYKTTGRKVHLVGHSLGGLLARGVAAQMPDRVASVISLAAPFRGIACHPWVQRAATYIRTQILERHGDGVLPACYTDACTCEFIKTVFTNVPKSVHQTAVYTTTDGIVDWRVCITGDPEIDREVSATHLGLVFNPIVYQLIAGRLADAQIPLRRARPRRRAA